MINCPDRSVFSNLNHNLNNFLRKNKGKLILFNKITKYINKKLPQWLPFLEFNSILYQTAYQIMGQSQM